MGEVVKSISAYAVPVFYMIAGYYAFEKDANTIKRRLFKVIKIFILAYFVYLMFDVSVALKNHEIIQWVENNYSITSLVKCICFCTIVFAVPLWYLIAQIETYILWYVVVKNNKEDIALQMMPILFAFYVLITTVSFTMGFDWFWKVNFMTCSLSWFMLGYRLHTLSEEQIKKIEDWKILMCGLLGITIILVPIFFDMKCNIASFGHFPYALSYFLLALKYKEKSICHFFEYLGEKLSLWIYIFHVPISTAIKRFVKIILDVEIEDHIYVWVHPIITVLVVILFSYIFDYMITRIEKIRISKKLNCIKG